MKKIFLLDIQMQLIWLCILVYKTFCWYIQGFYLILFLIVPNISQQVAVILSMEYQGNVHQKTYLL